MKQDRNRDIFISSNIKVAHNLENKFQYFLYIFLSIHQSSETLKVFAYYV